MFKQIAREMPPWGFVWRMLRWHVRYLFSKKVTPAAAGFYLTTACNFHCEFCNISRLKPPFTFTRDVSRSIIGQLGRLGLTYFSISGGEPLLVPYVFDLLAYARESGVLYTHMVSNGYLMTRERAETVRWARLSEISFSVDGPEYVHDVGRGMPGAYQRVLSAVDLIKTHAPGTKIVLNTILSPSSPDNALHCAELARSLQVSIKFQPENCHPAFDESDRAPAPLRVLDAQGNARLREVLGELGRMRHVANSGPFLANSLSFWLEPEKLAFRNDDCIFGYHHIEFFNGKLFPCLEGANWIDGFDPCSDRLDKVLSSSEYMKALESLRKCSACTRNYYICYYEPRLNFPVWNLIGSRLRLKR